MKKKEIIIIVCSVCVTIAILFAVRTFGMFGADSSAAPSETNSLTALPEYVESVNYNNYSQPLAVDCRYGKIVWVEQRHETRSIVLVDEKGEKQVLSGLCTSYSPRLQLHKDGLYYLDNENLYYKPYASDQSSVLIAAGATDFRAVEKGIYFLRSDESYISHLYWYDFATQKEQYLAKDIRDFLATDEALYYGIASPNPGTLYRYTEDGIDKVINVDIQALPFRFQLQGNKIVYELDNAIRFVDLTTGEAEIVPIVDSKYMLNAVNFICGEKYVYVAFHANSSDGSLIFSKDDPANGLWKIDSSTMKQTKLCDEYFNGIYKAVELCHF